MGDDIPKQVSSGFFTIMGCEIEVVHLDDGRRLITAESMERFVRMLENDGLDLKNITPGTIA